MPKVSEYNDPYLMQMYPDAEIDGMARGRSDAYADIIGADRSDMWASLRNGSLDENMLSNYVRKMGVETDTVKGSINNWHYNRKLAELLDNYAAWGWDRENQVAAQNIIKLEKELKGMPQPMKGLTIADDVIMGGTGLLAQWFSGYDHIIQGVAFGTAAGAVAGAGAGAMVGGAGALPGAAGGAVIGAATGFKMGSAEHAFAQTFGEHIREYTNLQQANGQPIDMDRAVRAAWISGTVSAGIEFLQIKGVAGRFGKYLGRFGKPAQKYFGQALSRTSKRFKETGVGKEFIRDFIIAPNTEAAEEAFQEATKFFGTYFLQEWDKIIAEDAEADPIKWRKLGEQMLEEYKAALPAMIGVNLPGMALSGVQYVAKQSDQLKVPLFNSTDDMLRWVEESGKETDLDALRFASASYARQFEVAKKEANLERMLYWLQQKGYYDEAINQVEQKVAAENAAGVEQSEGLQREQLDEIEELVKFENSEDVEQQVAEGVITEEDRPALERFREVYIEEAQRLRDQGLIDESMVMSTKAQLHMEAMQELDKRAEIEAEPVIELQEEVNTGTISNRVEMKTRMQEAIPTMTEEEADAILTVMSSFSEEQGIPLDEFIQTSIDTIKRDGVPSEAALFAKQVRNIGALRGANEKAVADYINDVVGDNDAQQYINAAVGFIRRQQSKTSSGDTALRGNQKTILSLDASTICPLTEAGVPCIYCYVEQPRSIIKAGKKPPSGAATKPIDALPYNREILDMPQELVDFFNLIGGLRMFSYGDYRPRDEALIQQMIDDAKERGLNIKAITKQSEFIKRFGKEPNLTINISTDMEFPDALTKDPRLLRILSKPDSKRLLSAAFPLEEARALKAEYPNMQIRYVAMNRNDAIRAIHDPDIDVVTMYHGLTDPERMKEVWQQQNPHLWETLGPDTVDALSRIFKPGAKAKTIAGKIKQKELDKVLGKGATTEAEFVQKGLKKTCCQTVCGSCKACCGWGRGRGADWLGAIVDGETLAAVEFQEDGLATVTAFKQATPAAFVHEVFHIFRRKMRDDDLYAVEGFYGIEEHNVWTREQEEKFADDFGQYLATRKAPTPALRRAFEALKRWIKQMYVNFGGEIHPDLEAIFDKILGGGEARKIIKEREEAYKAQVSEFLAEKPTKTRIRALTGQTKVVDAMVKESDALKFALKRMQEEAKKIIAEGRQQGVDLTKEKWDKDRLRRDARYAKLKERFEEAKEKWRAIKAAQKERADLNRKISNLKKIKKRVAELPEPHRSKMRAVFDSIDFTTLSAKKGLQLSKFREWLNTPDEQGGTNADHIALSPEQMAAIQRLDKMSVREMSTADFNELYDLLKSWYHIAQTKKALLLKKGSIDLDSVTDRFEAEVEAGPQLTQEEAQMPKGGATKAYEFIRRFMRSNATAVTLVNFLGGKGGIAYDVLVRQLIAADSEYAKMEKWFVDQIEGIRKTLSEQFGIKNIEEWATEKVQTGKHIFTRDQRMEIAKHALRPDNLRSLTDGGYTLPFGKAPDQKFVLTRDEVFEIVDSLTDAEKFMVAESGPIFDQLGDKVNEAHKLLRGYDIEKLANYYPLYHSPAFTFEGILQGEVEAREELKQQLTRAKILDGFTKRRVGSKAPVALKGLMRVLNDHGYGAIEYATKAVPVNNAAKFLYNNRIKQRIVNSRGKDFWDLLELALKDYAGELPVDKGTFAKYANETRSAMAGYFLGYNPSTMVMQLLGYIMMTNYVSATDLAAASTRALLPSTRKAVREKSAKIDQRIRSGEMNRELKELVASLGKTPSEQKRAGILTKLRRGSFFGIRKFDEQVAVSGFIAGYNRAMREFQEGKLSDIVADVLGIRNENLDRLSLAQMDRLATYYGEFVVENTQPSFNPLHRTAISRGTAVEKLISMFTESAGKELNVVMQALADQKHGRTAKAIGTFIMLQFAVSMVYALRSSVERGEDIEAEDIAWDTVENIFGALPVVRDALEYIIRSSRGEYLPSGDFMMHPAVADAAKAAQALRKGDEGKAFKYTLLTILAIFKMPRKVVTYGEKALDSID